MTRTCVAGVLSFVTPEALARSSVLALLLVGMACVSQTSRSSEPNESAPPGFVVSGDPESLRGATWTFRGRVDGTDYDLSGALLKPPGPGPFPAVILSHGSHGNAAGLMSILGPTMVGWGMVCIAVNYTHSEGVPIGRPGDEGEPGASHANVQRAQMTYQLLRQLGYVDMKRVALHGHSMGAWVSTALANEYPDEFRAATTTGGGVRPASIRRGPAPTPEQTEHIRTPFQLHHGGADETVQPSFDQRFANLLTEHGVENELVMYPGASHLQVRAHPAVLARIKSWYTAHGLF